MALNKQEDFAKMSCSLNSIGRKKILKLILLEKYFSNYLMIGQIKMAKLTLINQNGKNLKLHSEMDHNSF